MSIRKSIFALVALATLSVAALAPTGASAFGFGGHFARGQGPGGNAPSSFSSSRGPSSTSGTTTQPPKALARPAWGYGRRYGGRFCYWHPYVCSYR
jgi:hypothetical protein